MKKVFVLALLLISFNISYSAELLIETESFDNKGGWVVDQQFMDQMGSPYLLAHGMGVAVADASTKMSLNESGLYHIYVRTFNWTSPWFDGKGAGKFKVAIDGKSQKSVLGDTGSEWMWQYAGSAKLNSGDHIISLVDLTGFEGRCDAIYLSTTQTPPPSDLKALTAFRRKINNMPTIPTKDQKFDLVISGAGTAGMCAAMSAARLGLKVALINDRPVIGGCNSSEIRVCLGGHIEVGPYKELGNLVKEFAQTVGGNAAPVEVYRDRTTMVR